jgi:hypothetical protein
MVVFTGLSVIHQDAVSGHAMMVTVFAKSTTTQGIWPGCRNFLRLFRGVSKWFLAGYITVFECSHNLKSVTPTLIRAMMMSSTTQPT